VVDVAVIRAKLATAGDTHQGEEPAVSAFELDRDEGIRTTGVVELQARLDAGKPGGYVTVTAEEMRMIRRHGLYTQASRLVVTDAPEPDLSTARAKAQAFFDAWHTPYPIGARNAFALALDELFTEIVAAARAPAPREAEDDGA
jgi:hypothetical protein